MTMTTQPRVLAVLLGFVLLGVLALPRAAAAEHHPGGAALLLGGGVTQGATGEMRDVVDPGFLWSVRLTSNTNRVLATELHYTGSTQALHASGLDENARLLGTQLGGNLRLNVPLFVGNGLLEPFAFGGAGWGRYDLYDAMVNSSGIRPSDHIAVFPLGVGLAIASGGGWMLDARVSYRATLNDDLMRAANGRPESLASWSAELALGTELR